MSVYQLHRCVYDFVRAGEVSGSGVKPFDIGDYDLEPVERTAFDEKDVAALYRLRLHPVLLNRFCRAIGHTRDDYRKILEPFATTEERTGRWRKS